MDHSRLCLPEGLFTEESCKAAQERIRFELLVDFALVSREEEETGNFPPRPSEPLAFLLHGVLTEEECKFLRDRIDCELQGAKRVDITNRECDRAVLRSPELAKCCFARARPFLEKIVRHFEVHAVEQSEGQQDRVECMQSFTSREGFADELQFHAPQQQHPPLPVTLTGYDASRVLLSDEKSFNWEGSWELDSMKEVVTCLRYAPGDYFDQHEDDNQDGPGHSLETPVKSLFTGLLYLNSDFSGGSTNFKSHTDGHPVLLELNAGDVKAAGASGCLLFFFQKGLLHEGYKVQSGNKYVIRSDLFYKQVEKGALSPEEQQGLELLKEARELFAAGDIARSQKKWDQACKLNSAVQRMSFEG
mmetsp:Transcript_43442/g.86204  ORF Transcript_43442/g.86204 Transcript_43442/m.86204 type:complete len:361 (-) Transcript_43442:169-1251(-)